MTGVPGNVATDIVPLGTSMNFFALVGFGVAVAGLGGLLFMARGRRQQGGTSTDDVAAVGATVAQMPSRVPGSAPRLATFPESSEEANVPRWLRASVRAERFQAVGRAEAAPARSRPRSGTKFTEPPLDSATRMLVRYERVEVLDQPHEAYGRLLTEVGTNDEVDVLETSDAWALVRTPGGLTGWLSTMALDRTATETSAAVAEPAEPAEANEPRRARRRGRPATP